MIQNVIPKYKEDKAIAAVSLLLRHSKGQCDKYWLNKVMYYIERESLIQTGQPMFFDKLYSLKYGPIVSAIKDSIEQTEYPIDQTWSEFIRVSGKKVRLVKEVDISSLSEFEEEIIVDAYNKFKGWTFKRLKEFFHSLPENKDTNSREPIDYEEILRSVKASDEQIKEAISEIKYLALLEDTLSCAK